MSNSQLTFVVVAVLAIHLLVLGEVLIRRRPAHAFGWNLALAGALLAALAFDPKWLRAPVDLQAAGLFAFEALAVLVSILALRGYRAAMIGSWVVFALHLLASGLAVVFVLTFKINRLI